eukprot:CAMPEP_0206550722 /NCGR_PEP_ID=MMETSP0325_2-20121206/15144_1 /ASSEMBLY_ACC=CAM_ASM_000347 /TAXON_ID=2866 /ORGANISM="Crypthecodinium cohnii, Strain Seligo" /LENGTH=430 /DNA_ID=CAMNT_0054050439 /DNA_START=66 /DNA_END=1358 /DNA_ORIENTATION=-
MQVAFLLCSLLTAALIWPGIQEAVPSSSFSGTRSLGLEKQYLCDEKGHALPILFTGIGTSAYATLQKDVAPTLRPELHGLNCSHRECREEEYLSLTGKIAKRSLKKLWGSCSDPQPGLVAAFTPGLIHRTENALDLASIYGPMIQELVFLLGLREPFRRLFSDYLVRKGKGYARFPSFENRTFPDVNRIPKLSVKAALEIFGRTSELDLLSVVEAWLLNLNEEGYSHILQNPAYDRWVMEKLPIVALKAAVVPSYENHVEAIQAWAKAKFHAGEAAAREVELPHESLSGQELAKGMKKTNLDAILLLIAGNTSSREEVNRLSMVLDRQVGGPLRFGAQKELVDVAANSNHSMAGSITTIYLYTIADVFFGSWSTCSDGDLLLAELRHANLGKASGPVAFLVDDPIDQPPACKEETMLFSDLWATFPVPKT